MKKKLNIDLSIREKKLLLIFLAFLVFILAYQFVFVRYMDKTDRNNKEIETLSDRVSELRQIQIKEIAFAEDIENFKKDIEEIKGKFINKETPEDKIMFIRTMEKDIGIEVSEINLFAPMIIGGNTEVGVTSTQTTDTGSTEINDPNTAQSQTNNDETDVNENTQINGDTPLDSNSLVTNNGVGMNHKISIRFKASYDQLKKMINYIKDFPYLRTIDSLSTSFDSETGLLVGDMTLNVYTLHEGTNHYKEPETGVNDLGVSNIFGTIQ